ncbi:hypothetical protein ACTWP5_28225 [Streptomyces sp. 4N509B]|uniref:hypothetical protein n=1 Tax=Streptomyces sp. 4N509B TaxID=3457413 RepID=UPI003FCF89C5
MERMLGALGTIATILGIVTQYLDYRMRRDASRRAAQQPSRVSGEPPRPVREEARERPPSPREEAETETETAAGAGRRLWRRKTAPAPVPEGRETMPRAVQALSVLLLTACVLSLVVAYLFASTLLRNVDNFGYEVDSLPRGLVVLISGVFTLLVAAIVVPGAVRRWYQLRHGDEMFRVKLISAAVATLFLGVALVVATLVVDDVTDVRIPDDVSRVVALFLIYVIIVDLGYLLLLALPSVRRWFEEHHPRPQ